MSKKLFALVILVMMLFAIGCQSNGNNDDNYAGDDGEINEKGGIEEKNENGRFVYKGTVTSISNDRYIEMEIIDSEIAFGIYWVLIGDQTSFVDNDGASISRNDIKVGDTIEVVFSGQVMMSYPPQIAAQKIILK